MPVVQFDRWFGKRRTVAPPTEPLPAGTVTFLFTDIEGSTRLWEAQEGVMSVALNRHDALLRQAIRDNHGHVFKTGGDAFYAVFAAASDAVAAALAGQQALQAEPWPPTARLRVRMALHSGTAELRERDYYGPTLNRVARLLAIGHGGQTLLSDSSREMCAARLPPGTILLSLGEHALKDLARPEPVYQLCHPTLPRAFPALKTVSAPVEESIPSIAVLPFANLSRDEENEYFADGLSNELLNVLSKIRGLRVASRTSAFSFKGKDVDVVGIAQKLNVAHVLEGSVRKSGKRVRITAELVRVATDSHLWSETYDRELDDIFAVQDDIAQAVVKELRHALLHEALESASSERVKAEVEAAAMGRSENAEAYRLYLQAQFFRDQLAKDRTAKGIEFFVQALQMDPGYALAWAGLSRAYSDQAGQNWVPRAEGYAKARAAAERALKVEPTLPEAHTALGWVQSSCDWDWKAADASFQRALELAPGSALAINAAATLAGNVGRLHEAVDLFKRATTMDPLNATIHRNLGLYALAADIPEVAESALNEALLLNPSGGLTNCWCALLRLAQGRKDEAFEAATKETNEVFRLVATAVVEFARGDSAGSDAALATLIEKCGEFSAYQVAGVYAYRNEADSAFQWLERTYAQRDPGVTYVKMDPLMRGLRTDPRWRPFIEKLGLAD
jgi:TolB-like protein/class 3 adenylate cyclase/Tfp pilus assembly protein PilF